jgi:NitT/TauT family transport system substrate-binding protein
MLQRKTLLKLLAVPVLAMGTLMAPAQDAVAEDVTYLLPAPGFLPAFSPWMMALGKGYYKAEGLNVKFQTARGGVDVAKQVGAGNAIIGGGIGDTPIIVRPNGIPVKAVAVLGGGSLMHLTVDANSGIKSIADLKGKTITALSLQDTTYYALLGMLASAGLSKHDVKAQAAGPVGVWKLFMAGKSQAMASVGDWTALVQSMGKKVVIFPADKYFKSMAQAILASDKVIKEQPQLIAKLVRATLRGLNDVMTDPKGSAKAYVTYVKKHAGKEKYIENTFKLFNKYTYAGQKTIGAMDEKRLASLQKFYVKQGIVRKSTPVKDLYTNRFVK